MTYHLKPNRKKNLVPRIVVGVVIVLVILIHIIFPNFFITIFSKVGIPVLQGEGGMFGFFGGIGDGFSSNQNLARENRVLQEKIDAFKVDHDATALLALENAELKKLLGRATTTRSTVLSTVLARPPQTAYDSVILDIGEEMGLAVGDQILAYADVPIGRISEVHDGFSKAILFSSPGQSVNVVVGTSTYATAEAMGGGSFRIKIPQETAAAEGDPVAIPSIKAEIFGSVVKIDSKEGDAFKYLFFQSPVNISAIRWVQVEASAKTK
jgi:cell shape-determining protein MreC